MASIMNVDIVDSESRIFAGDTEYLVVSANDGEIGIYPHHVPLICKLKPGVLRIKLPGLDEQKVFAISGGFLEVCNNNVIVMADIVERTDELDEKRLIEQKNHAIEKLKHNEASSTYDVAKAQVALEIAIAQLKVLDYIRKKI
ncbi:MAG: F0F1 ATP synthase subunit epsilon [Burkholderiales bacterium]|nr:F0F1 ATP synthase subunit epsilon [Burkholderiales bacterium]